MPRPFSTDLREGVASARADGRICREVARLPGDYGATIAERRTLASYDTVWHTPRFLGYSFKKGTPVADEHDRPDVKRCRERRKCHQGRADPRKLVSLSGVPIIL